MSPRHALAAVLVAVVWGVNFVVIHVGLATTPPLLLAALRFALVAGSLAWFVPRPALAWPRLVALGLALYVGQFGLLFTAMDVGLSAGLAAVVMQAQAVFTVVAAVALLGERPGRSQVAGVAVATCGLLLIGLDRGGADRQQVLGFVLCLLAGASWAAGNLLARTAGVTQGLGLVVWGSVVAAPVLGVLALWQVGPARLPAALAAVIVAVVWGVNFVVIHVGLTTTPPLLLAALRFALVAGSLAWFVPRPALAWPRLVALGLALYVGQFGLLFTAMDVGLSAGLAAVVMQAQAVFTVVAAVALLGERPGRSQVAGVAVATGGLLLIGLDRGGSSPLGFVLCLLAGASWAAGNLLARTAGVTQGLGLVVWGSVVAAPVLGVLALWQVGPARLPAVLAGIDGAGLLALAYLTVLATVVGFGTWSALMGRYPAAVVAPFTMLVPPVGLAAAWLALGERPSALAVAGSALVVGGLLLPQLRRLRRRAAAAPAAPDAVVPGPA